MSPTAEDFLCLPEICALGVKDRFIALIWWHQAQGTPITEFDTLCEELSNAGYAGVNKSREKAKLIKDTRTVSANKGKSFRISVQATKDMEAKFSGLLVNRPSAQVASDLRALMPKIKNETTRAFVDEAVKCYEHNLYRSAVVMSWLAAVDILQNEVLAFHLKTFNAEASRVDPRWKPAKTTDGIGRMKESDFLDRISAISVIGPNVKTELKVCLDRRNACGHPNSYKIERSTTAHHIETLIANVFSVFS